MGVLQGIGKTSIGSGSVQYALIAKMEDVELTFVDADGSTPSTLVYTLTGGTGITPSNTPFKKYAFNQETASADAPQVGVPAQGTSVFTHTVNMTFSKRDAALRNEIQLLCSTEVVVVMLDCNGYAEGYGGQCGRGLFVTTGTANTGVASGDLNGYVISLTVNQKKLPYTVEASELFLIDPDQI